MSKLNDIILLKLESSINGWSDEVVNAHSLLTRQINEAKDQLDTLLKIVATRSNSGPALKVALEQAAQLKSELEQNNEAIAFLNEAGRARDTQVEGLSRSLASLNAENDGLRCELEDTESIRQELETDAGRQVAEARTLAEEVQGLRAQIDALNLESARVLEEKEALQKEHLAAREKAEENAKAHEQALWSLQEERDALAQSGEKARGKLEHLQEQLSEAAETQGRLDSERESLCEEIAQTKSVLDETKGELVRTESIRQELVAKAGLHEAEAGILAEEVQALSAQIDALNLGSARVLEEKRDQEAKNASLRIRLDESSTALDALQRERLLACGRAEEDAKAHERALWILQEERDALAQSGEKAREKLAQLQEQLSEAARTQGRLDSERRSLRREVARTKSRLDETRGELEAVQDLQRHTLKARDALAEEIHEHQATFSEQSLELKSSKETIEALKTTVSEKESALEGAVAEAHAYLKELESRTQAELTRRDAAQAVVEGRLHDAQNRLNELQTKLESRDDHERECIRLLAQAGDALKAEIEHHKGRFSTIEQAGDAVTSPSKGAQSNQERVAEIEHARKSGEDRIRVLSEECDQMRQNGRLLDEAQQEIGKLKQTLTRRDDAIDTLRERNRTTPVPVEGEGIPLAAYDARGRRRSMGEILVNAGIITEKQLKIALEEQRSSKERRLGTILTEKGLIQEQVVARVLASQLNLPFVEIGDFSLEPEVVNLISGERATHHVCIPMSLTSEGLTLAMANPLDVVAIEDIEIIAGHTVLPVVATLTDITSTVVRHYGPQTAVTPFPDSLLAHIRNPGKG